jgi:phosphate transport system permease protein
MPMNVRYLKNSVGMGILWSCGLLTIGVMLMITLYILLNGLPSVGWEFLTTDPAGKNGGIYCTIVATLFITAVALLVSAPLSILGAIYMAEYAGENRVTQLVRFGADSLAGIPSIMIGLFGFLLFVSKTDLGFGFSLLSGSLAVALMALPITLRVSEEAIKVVPESYRHGSLALGSTRWQTIRKVVLPAAIPGIITGVMLSMGRIMGETAVFLLTTGSVLRLPVSPFDPCRPMTVHLYILATENISLPKAFGTGAVLLIMVLAITLTSNFITRIYLKKMGGRR